MTCIRTATCVLGRLDAVLLDHVLAEKAMRRERGLATQPGTVAVGHYVGVLDGRNAALRDRVDGILPAGHARRHARDASSGAGASGTTISRGSSRACSRMRPPAPAPRRPRGPGGLAGSAAAVRRYLPALFKAALITIVLSCLSMALAVGVGVLVASGRVYGGRALRGVLTAYVEVTRGTPVLLQLFVLYYGLAEFVRLPAFVAALLGLGLNYAAYESEIYRGALEAVPRGQLEAARVLGLSERQVFTLVRGPAGAAPRAGADDQRLRRAAQGLVAGVGADRRRADQADADLRGQHRQLGRARRAVRAAVPGDVAAALQGGAAARGEVEGAHVMSGPCSKRAA